MTTKTKQKEIADLTKLHFDENFCTHFLSPLSQAAVKADYQPFTYTYDGYAVRIGSDVIKELLEISKRQETIHLNLILQIRAILIETNSEHAEFLSTLIKDMGFSTRTRHGLMSCYPEMCNTMLDVAKLGSYRISRLRMLGPKSVEEVRKAFIKAGCVELFDVETRNNFDID